MSLKGKRFVAIESPFAPNDEHSLAEHIAYARAAMSDCFKRGEIPFGSHVIYTLGGILDDRIKAERRKGMNAGFDIAELFGTVGGIRAVYDDLGMSPGMIEGIAEAKRFGQRVEFRSITWSWPWHKRLCHYLRMRFKRLLSLLKMR